MLDKNILVRDTIRMFLAEVQKFEIDSKEVADDAKVLQIINKMIKQRNDSIDQGPERIFYGYVSMAMSGKIGHIIFPRKSFHVHIVFMPTGEMDCVKLMMITT